MPENFESNDQYRRMGLIDEGTSVDGAFIHSGVVKRVLAGLVSSYVAEHFVGNVNVFEKIGVGSLAFGLGYYAVNRVTRFIGDIGRSIISLDQHDQ